MGDKVLEITKTAKKTNRKLRKLIPNPWIQLLKTFKRVNKKCVIDLTLLLQILINKKVTINTATTFHKAISRNTSKYL